MGALALTNQLATGFAQKARKIGIEVRAHSCGVSKPGVDDVLHAKENSGALEFRLGAIGGSQYRRQFRDRLDERVESRRFRIQAGQVRRLIVTDTLRLVVQPIS